MFYQSVFVSTLTVEYQSLCFAVCPPGGKMAALAGPWALRLLMIGVMISWRMTPAMTQTLVK